MKRKTLMLTSELEELEQDKIDLQKIIDGIRHDETFEITQDWCDGYYATFITNNYYSKSDSIKEFKKIKDELKTIKSKWWYKLFN